jgi:hypothetical protein
MSNPRNAIDELFPSSPEESIERDDEHFDDDDDEGRNPEIIDIEAMEWISPSPVKIPGE